MGPPPVMPVGGVAPMNPGSRTTAVFDFVAGEYFMICFVPDRRPARRMQHSAWSCRSPCVSGLIRHQVRNAGAIQPRRCRLPVRAPNPVIPSVVARYGHLVRGINPTGSRPRISSLATPLHSSPAGRRFPCQRPAREDIRGSVRDGNATRNDPLFLLYERLMHIPSLRGSAAIAPTAAAISRNQCASGVTRCRDESWVSGSLGSEYLVTNPCHTCPGSVVSLLCGQQAG